MKRCKQKWCGCIPRLAGLVKTILKGILKEGRRERHFREMRLSKALIKSQNRKMVGMGHQVICSACRLDRLQDNDDNVDNI